MSGRLQTAIITPAASPEEAAAMVAGIEQFVRDTAHEAAPAPVAPGLTAWQRAALVEGVARQPGLPL